MRDEYLNQVIRRGNELSVLDQAARRLENLKTSRGGALRWAVAAGLGLLTALIFKPHAKR